MKIVARAICGIMMDNLSKVFLALCCFSAAVYSANVVHFSAEKVEGHIRDIHIAKSRPDLSSALSHVKLQGLGRIFWPTQRGRGTVKRGLGHFAWKNCGTASQEMLVIKSLTISPDPIHLPGNITVSMAATFTQIVDAPLKVDLVLEKSLFGLWIKIPCVDNIGSCTYDDVCEALSGVTCPQPFTTQRVPCKCPFNAGSYNLTKASFNLPISSDIPDGDYRATATLTYAGKFVGCYYIAATLAD